MKRVILDRPYSYKIDARRKRTLPTGWRGEVDDKVAVDIGKRKFGRVIKPDKPARKPAGKVSAGTQGDDSTASAAGDSAASAPQAPDPAPGAGGSAGTGSGADPTPDPGAQG